MGFNEIRVRKAREDQSVDELVNKLDDLGGCKFLFPPNELFLGLQELLRSQLEDVEEACRAQDCPASDFFPEDDNERASYVEHLTQCAWQHFHQQAPEKFRVALAELIQESLIFAYPIYRQRCGFGEVEINDSRPSLADLQNNVLRRSILRLKSLPYQKREGVDGEENNEALRPNLRASAEIHNHLAYWTYDHVRVYELLRPYIRSFMEKAKGYDDPSHSSHLAANDAAEFIWDNIDGAMQAMTFILVEYSIRLATASLKQRHPAMLTPAQMRANLPSASDLQKIAAQWLDLWHNSLTVKLSKRGRTPKDESNRLSEREQTKSSVINAMLKVLDEPEKISQWRVSKILGIGNWRNPKDRTLYNRLSALNLNWSELAKKAKQIHKQRRTKK